MIKKEIYPKTPRMKVEGEKVFLTEKLDGSNLVFFKKNDELYFAQRNNIFALSELETDQQISNRLYKGLYQWLKDYGTALKDNLNEGSAICGEWLGMGTLKYTVDEFDKRWYMFAKANVDDDFNLYNMKYDHELFVYPFIDQAIPVFMGVVPEVADLTVLPNKKHLDSLYAKYVEQVGRNVEGFVINYQNIICKYVRMKGGKVIEYSDTDHKNLA
jgi:hypothetical protein